MEQAAKYNNNTLIIFIICKQTDQKNFSQFYALILYCITIYLIHALYACMLPSYA